MAFPEDADPNNPTELDRMRLAFGVFVGRRIVEADGILDIDEIDLLTMAFPNAWMETCGFIDEATQLTPACRAAYDDACKILPVSLSLPEKLDLITLFHRTCMADGELHERELAILMSAAQLLHVQGADLREHLLDLRGTGPLVPAIRKG
jgi:uncharacterized tellurite resistance protein B-like protein